MIAFLRLLLNPVAALGTLWRHRDLLLQFTGRYLHLRHKGSFLGLFWAILNPLLMLGLYTFVFGVVFGGRFNKIANETQWDYALGIFLGLTCFHLIAETMATAPTLIVNNPNFVKKVVFPLEILPAAAVGAAVYHAAISLTLLLIATLVLGAGASWSMLLLPVIVLPLLFLAVGLAWLLAALGVFVRDIAQVMQVLALVLLYCSAIFFSVEVIPPLAWTFLKFNPLLHAIDAARHAVLWHQPVSGGSLLYLYAVSFAVFFFGYACFLRTKPAFADVL